MTLVAGVDIGGTKTLAVAVDGTGAVVAATTAATLAGGPDAVGEHAVATLRGLAAETGRDLGSFAAAGIGLPGIVDPERGEVRHAVNLGIDGRPAPLRAVVQAATGVPAVVVNDVAAGAVGAASVLGLRDADLAYLSIGTGVAAGLLLGGTLRRGWAGAAGEIGHVVVDPAGPPCPCGQRGCLEVLVSGPAIARRWPHPAGDRIATRLVEAAAAREPGAARVLTEVAHHLAAAVQLLALTVDPALVVLGGGVAQAGEPLLGAIRDALTARAEAVPLLRDLDLAARLRAVPPDAAPGAIGAALLAGAPEAAPAPSPAP